MSFQAPSAHHSSLCEGKYVECNPNSLSSACVSVCSPSAQGPSPAATAERPLSFGRRPESVTAADWTSCLLLFLPSYLLRRIFCLPLCERAVIGRLVVQHLTPKLISTHAAVGGRQFFLFLCVSVCVCLTGQAGTQTPSCWIVGAQRTLVLFVCFCFFVALLTDGKARGRQ